MHMKLAANALPPPAADEEGPRNLAMEKLGSDDAVCLEGDGSEDDLRA